MMRAMVPPIWPDEQGRRRRGKGQCPRVRTTKKDQRTLYLPGPLWTRLRVQAVHKGSRASKIIERLVEAYLKTKKG